MKLTTTALGLVLALAAAPIAAQMYSPPSSAPQQTTTGDQPNQKQPQIQPSSGARKAIVDLQTAVNANEFTKVPGLVAAAQSVAKTKEDRYIIGQLQVKAALAAKDNVMLAAAIDTVAASGYVDQAKVAELYMGLGTTFYNAKDFARAATAYERAASLNPRSPDPLINIAESRYGMGQKAEAVATFQRAIQATIAAGQKPREDLLKRTAGIAYEASLPTAADLSRQWVAAYPSPGSWHDAVAIYRNLNKPDVEGTLVLFRLMQATNSLQGAADYSLFATAAADQSNFNEAKAVIDQGIAANQVDPANPLFRDLIAAMKTKPVATEADLNAALKMAPSAGAQIRIGDRFYGSGNYAKAAEVYRAALGKPGVDANVANLHLGMALARTGDKAGAAAALNAVSGPHAPLAKYWLLYLSTR
jgi:tetratricopeptide (TPR) repeat protein